MDREKETEVEEGLHDHLSPEDQALFSSFLFSSI